MVAVLAIGYAIAARADYGYAGAAAERSALERIDQELAALDALIEEARSAAEEGARYRFEYPWLAEDLKRIRAGIREYLAQPEQRPRDLSEIEGSYLQQKRR